MGRFIYQKLPIHHSKTRVYYRYFLYIWCVYVCIYPKPQKRPPKATLSTTSTGQDANDDLVLHTALAAGKEIEVHTSCAKTTVDEKNEHVG